MTKPKRSKKSRRRSQRLKCERLESRLLLASDWLDSARDYRVELAVDANGFQRNDRPADVALDFTSLLNQLGENSALDVDSLRVIEVDANGQTISPNVPFQFDRDPGFDAATMASGTLVVMVEGQTLATESRYFQTYFDVVGDTFSPPSFTDLVDVTDNVTDQGQVSFQVTTLAADYFYHKQGAGYSSIVDGAGNDWVSYQPTTGSSGEFRGIPNMIYPGDGFHPGDTNGTSTLVHDGPLKSTIHSQTDDGKWEATWEIYPGFATMTVLKTAADYWFLYEGTPGGSLDTNSDTVVRADGTETLASETWDSDLAGDEWVYFTDPALGRSLFAANHQDDTAADSYRPMNGEMTVFGFGRSGLNRLMNAVPAKFTIGLMEETDFGQASPIINSAYKELSIAIGSAQKLAPEAPVAADDAYQATRNQTLTVDSTLGVLVNDSDVNGDVLQATLVDTVANGSLTLNADGSFEYTPTAGFTGTDSFSYRASDGSLDSNLATVTLSVLYPPTAVDDAYQTSEDTSLNVAAPGVLGNDIDNEAPNDMTARLVSGPTNGTLTSFATDGSFTYVPDANFNGSDSFVYAAEDGMTGTWAEATVGLTVNSVNDVPIAVNDVYTTEMDKSLTVDATGGILANDSDADQDTLQAVLVDNASHGLLTLNADGSFQYTPNTGFDGVDSFTYRASDSLAQSDLTVVNLQVASLDPDLLVALPLDEGSGSVAGDTSGNGNDGTLLGGATFEATSPNGSASSIRLDGIDDAIDLGALDVNGSGLTLATWFNADSYPGPSQDPRLISKATGVSANDHVFMLSTIKSGSDVRLRARVRVGGSTATLIANSGALSTGQWYHAAVTYDANTLRLYLDGTEVGSTSLTGAVDVDPNVSVAIGAQPTGAGDRYFDGRMDDVHILQRGLNASEVAALMTGNTPPIAVDDAFSVVEDQSLAVSQISGVLANDSDANFDSLQATLMDDVSNGSLTFNANGSFDYSPNPNFNGTDSFTYVANDGSLDSSLATVVLTVTAVNDPPTAVEDAYFLLPDSTLNVDASEGVLANDSDVDLDAIDAILVDNVTNGLLTLNSDGSFDYTPSAGFSGTDSFTYRAADGVLDSSLTTVTLSVLFPPTAVDDAYQTDEDSTLEIAAPGVLANDVDNEPPADLTAQLITGPGNGTLTSFAADGSFTYVPNANFNGSDSFVYAAEDGVTGAWTEATVAVTVNSVNDAPVAVDDGYRTEPDTVLTVDATGGVLSNDSDVDQDTLEAVLVDNVGNGSLILDADGSFQYTPNAGFVGNDFFTYRASDSLLESDLTVVNLQVVSDDPDLLVTLPLDEGSGSVAGDTSGYGNDGTLLGGATFEATSPNGSAASIRLDGVDDAIDLGAIDVNGSGLTLATWFNADGFPGSSSDPRLISKATGVSANDHVFMLSTIRSGQDVRLRARVRTGGQTTTLIASSGALATGQWYHAAVTYNQNTLRLYLDGTEVGSTAMTGAVDVDPNVSVMVGGQPAGAGDRFFDGLLDDVHILQRGLSASEVTDLMTGNAPPVAVDDAYTLSEDVCYVVDVSNGLLINDSDLDFDPLQVRLVDSVSNGTLSITEFGAFEYTPDPDFHGTDSFTYVANDGSLDSNLATVFLTVTAVNDAPVAVADDYLASPETVLSVSSADGVLANDFDVDLDLITAVLVDDVSNGSLTLSADGSFDYTPNTGFTGTDSFTYRANDGTFDSLLATVTILVAFPPTVADEFYQTDEDVSLAVAAPGVLANDIDNEAPNDLTARLVSGPIHGTLTSFAIDGSFTYVPDPDFNGSDSFVYAAEDGVTGAWAEATALVTVHSVNDAPVAMDDNYAADPDTPLTVDVANGVLNNDTDVDQDSLQAVLVSNVTNGSLTLNPDGSFQYTPDSGFVGNDSFTYRASDSVLESDLVTVTIVVDGAFRFWYGRNMDVGLLGTPQRWFNVIGNVSDPDGVQSLTYSLNDGPDVAMGIGANDRRLVYDGDFNADLLIEDLVIGTNQLELTMLDNLGNSESATVTINRYEPTLWEFPEFIDWSSASSVVEKAVPVDGVWSLDASNSEVRVDVEHAGYDRLLAIGETTWTNYQVSVPVTFNQFVEPGPRSGGQAFGLIAGWNGHNDTVGASQPLEGFLPDSSGESPTPFGAIAWWRGRIEIVNKDAVKVVSSPLSIEAGQTYQLKLQVEKVTDGTIYRFKMWPAGTAEPGSWLTYNAPDDELEPVSGSIALLAHEASVAFGNVVITNLDAPSDPPAALNDAYAIDEDNTLAVSSTAGVLSNDIDGQFPNDLTAALTTAPINGTLTELSADGAFQYVPDLNFFGTDTFTYRAVDGQSGAESTATVTLTVNPVNDAPVAFDDNYVTPPDTIIAVDSPEGVLANDSDVDLDAIDAVLVDNVTSGSLVLNSDGSFNYTPDPGFTGTDSFTYRASDGTLDSALSTVTLAVQFPPTAVDDVYATDEDVALQITAPGLLGNDIDNVAPNELIARLVEGPTNGALTFFSSDGSFTYAPSADFNGADTFVYAAEDAITGAWNEATVTLTVNSVNDVPLSADDSYTLGNTGTLSIDATSGVLANDIDVDQDPLEAVLVDNATNGSLLLNADGSFEYTPNPGFVGTDSFTYRASDAVLESSPATVFLDVRAITSDEFNTGVLDSSLWTFVDPLNDGSVDVSGGAANITVPAGSSHDIWTSGVNAARLMQDVQNVDFSVEAKFDTPPAGRYAMTGILVRSAGGDYLRFGFYSDGSKLNLFAALISGGSATVLFNGAIASPADSLYMRINRNGDSWLQQYSTDGVTWQTGASTSITFDMAAIGIYAGNAGGSSAPAFTTNVDYFRSL